MVRARIYKFSGLTLGGIRLLNGVAALFVPQLVARRLNVEDQPGSLYVLRLFGIRTLILGIELLFLRGKRLEWSIQVAPLIHASDTAAAAIGGIRGQLPHRAAILTTLISATNTGLALVAKKSHEADPSYDFEGARSVRNRSSRRRTRNSAMSNV
ncbi:MAG TPA: hypothetical protein VJT49_01670 [Amycolatopsis sp.]|uniref:hypothetical protein n=1 Tax=Amycolatopsis sp. TaxID=37632 RepID=UPI002B481CE2|nr:hypothetical protein [Amycolatopsis sp.]HKS43821.1 hypothetical protein [Amycolatopsis sp.]